MLKDRNSSAIVAVTDIERARAFYEDTLGLTRIPAEGEEDMLEFQTGDTRLTVYRSEFAGTNRANAVTWEMKGDLVETVRSLQNKGVAFEHYEMPGTTLEGDVHVGHGMKVAWFKDPDGNLNLIDQ